MPRRSSDSYEKRPLDRKKELTVAFSVCIGLFLVCFIFIKLKSKDSGNWSTADPSTVGQRVGEQSHTTVSKITVGNGISSAEANLITMAYLTLHTDEIPNMTLPSPIPNDAVDYWTMDLYYLDDKKSSKRKVMVHRSNGEVTSEGLPKVSLEELAKSGSLTITKE